MNPWKILEITPTSDKKMIKRAYAAKLKTMIPDEQPEEFQCLKTAFDLALTLSKNDSLIEDDPFTSIDATTEIAEEFSQASDDYTHHGQSSFPAFQPLERFSDQLQKIIDEENYFENVSVWEVLLASIDSWSIDEYMQNTYTIQLFLVENYPCLAREIIRFLFQTFDLTELTDHIGQERFVSTHFLELKKVIYNVPPFSFQIAENIPANLRKKYFHLRYEIYQIIANKQSYITSIDDKIRNCAEIFAEDSELWNLQMIDLLDKTNGFLENEDALKQYKFLLNRTQTMNSSPTTIFLNRYFMLLTETQTDDAIFNWNKEQLTIPEELFLLILGCIFFKKSQYVPAFNLWKQLNISRKIALQEQFKVILPHLSKDQKVDYLLIEKEVRRVLEPKTEMTVSFKKGFMFLFCSLLVLLFMVQISSRPQTPRRIGRTPEELVKAYREKHSNQQKAEEIEAKEASDSELYGDSLEERFVHYFYASDDPKGKQLFIDRNVNDVQLKKLLSYYVDQDTHKYSDSSGFKFKSNTVSDPNSKKTAVYYKEELLCILESGAFTLTLENVYGNQWHLLSDIKFKQLLNTIEINPESSTTTFLKKFLFSDNKQENLLEYTDYLSENMKIILENKLNEPISDNLRKGFLYLVREPKLKFIVSDQNQENEEKLILTFDEQGRLDHVFGPNWEEVDEEMIHYSNREAFKNIPTLLEEPD